MKVKDNRTPCVDTRGRAFLVPFQIGERRDKLEMASTDIAALLADELAVLRI